MQRQSDLPGGVTSGSVGPEATGGLLGHGSIRSSRRIPEATVARLPVYLRCLLEVLEAKVTTISSERLAEMAGVNAAKVRKDSPTSAPTARGASATTSSTCSSTCPACRG